MEKLTSVSKNSPKVSFRPNPTDQPTQDDEGGDALSIELIEISGETSFKNKQEQKEKLKKEEEQLRKTVENNPQSRRAKLELAKFLFHQNEFNEAEELSFAVLKIDDTNANAYCLLGRIYGFGEPQNPSKSEEYFKKALDIDNEYAKAHYFYAYLLRSRLQRYKEAEEHYKAAMKLRPDDVTSYNDCAIMLVRQSRINEAKLLYEKVLQLQPDHSIAHFNLANLLRKDLKDYKLAEKHFLISIQKRPKFTAALNNYATMLHHQLNRFNDAEHYYKSALNIDPKYSRAHFNYANLCREHLKKYNLAQEHYLLAIQFDNTNPNFYNNYGLLLQYALREYEKAKKQYEIALKLDNNHALGHCNYATILMQMVDTKYNSNFDENTLEFIKKDTKKDIIISDDPYFDNDEYVEDYIPKYVTNKNFESDTDTKTDNDIEKNDDDRKDNDSDIDLKNINTAKTWTDIYRNNKYKNVKEEYMTKSEYHFKLSIFLNNKLVMAYNNYGCLLRRLNKQNNAKKMFEKALSIDPTFIMAKRNLDRSNGKTSNYNSNKKIYKNDKYNVNFKENIVNDKNHVSNQYYKQQKMNDDGCLIM